MKTVALQPVGRLDEDRRDGQSDNAMKTAGTASRMITKNGHYLRTCRTAENCRQDGPLPEFYRYYFYSAQDVKGYA